MAASHPVTTRVCPLDSGSWHVRLSRWLDDERLIAAGIALLVFAIYCATAQAHINGSRSPYATDVGEIQNALPRWGTLHFTGYPQYSLLGSAFVTLLSWVGFRPALSASLFSAVWSALTAALTYRFARELGTSRVGAIGASAISRLALSPWMDASLAEVHTMTVALSVGALLAGVRFHRTGDRAQLLWLAGLAAHGVIHQRAVLFLAPSLLVLVWGRWGALYRHAGQILMLALSALATYLYLPLRAWMGADWTFNAPGTWQGFWTLVLDTKSDRIVRLPATLGEVLARGRNIIALLSQDLPLLILVAGLLGLGLLFWRRRRAEALSLALIMVVHIALTVVIWEGRTSDALLAVKLPVDWACAVGLAFLVPTGARRWWRALAAVAFLALGLYLGWRHAPQVLAVTRDRSSEQVVQRVAQLAPPAQPTTVWTPWGHDYWALRYAQTYRGELPGLVLVDHNAPVAAIIASGQRLVTPQETFYVFAPDWWQVQLGGLALSSAGEGLVQVSSAPQMATYAAYSAVALGQGVAVVEAAVARVGDDALAVRVRWLAEAAPTTNLSVAVHLIGWPAGSDTPGLLSQADSQHPVYGWSPTSSWRAGEVIRDDYRLTVPPGARAQEVRVFMYTHDDAGFHNTEAVTIPVP
jgi:hypothetical protein